MRRVLDVTVGTVLLLATVPVVAVLAAVVALELRAWPFFVHERVGRGGKPFRFVKLRTLPPTSPAYALKHSLVGPPLSPVRRWMRDRHFDELPQLIHVVAGTMSLVGPRPKMPDAYEPVDPTYATERLRVKPGCTCLWQVGAHTHQLPSEAPEYDLFYVRHANVRLDLWLMWRTLLDMLGIARPVELWQVPRWTWRSGAPTPADVLARTRRLQAARALSGRGSP